MNKKKKKKNHKNSRKVVGEIPGGDLEEISDRCNFFLCFFCFFFVFLFFLGGGVD